MDGLLIRTKPSWKHRRREIYLLQTGNEITVPHINLMEVSDQLYTPAALSSRKKLLVFNGCDAD
jgi:hypothetical protein